MILPDVNPLVYAFRPDAVHHEVSHSWLASVLSDPAPFGVSPMILAAVVRLTTNRRVFAEPSSLEQAFEFCDYLLTHPNCRVIEPGERHWGIFRDLCIATDTSGGHTTDTWYAALAIEWNCEWISYDSDFARFPGLKWRRPV